MQTGHPNASYHPAQMAMLKALSLGESKAFSELQKASGLTGDHANFHIKRLIQAGLVEHVPKSYGLYRLTTHGKQYANQLSPDSTALERQPKVSVVLWVKDNEGKLLRQRRLRQPYYSYWTRPTGKIRQGETVLEAAARKLRDEAGLSAELRIIGVEHRIDKATDGTLLDDKYLFTVEGLNPTGEFLKNTPFAENYWLTEHEYAKKEKRFANADKTVITIDKQTMEFSEGVFYYEAQDY